MHNILTIEGEGLNMNKKFRKSPIAIACYVIAALILIYTISTIVGTVTYLQDYFAAYGMTMASNMKDSLSYILSSCVQPLSFAVLIFMAGYILEEVRSQNPDYYYTDEEAAARKAAKAEAKAAKKAAKEKAKEAKAIATDAVAEEAEAEKTAATVAVDAE